MNKVTIFFVGFLFCACHAIKSTNSVHQQEIVNTISIDISNRLQRHFNTITSNAKVSTPCFEDADSVSRSIGYFIFNQLVSNCEKSSTGEVREVTNSITHPYLLFSEVILDESEKYCMLSYVQYYGALAAEEVCAIYRIEKNSKGSLSVDLIWSQSLWVS